MGLDVISPALLVLAISLSWNRFTCIFNLVSSASLAAAPLTTGNRDQLVGLRAGLRRQYTMVWISDRAGRGPCQLNC